MALYSMNPESPSCKCLCAAVLNSSKMSQTCDDLLQIRIYEELQIASGTRPCMNMSWADGVAKLGAAAVYNTKVSPVKEQGHHVAVSAISWAGLDLTWLCGLDLELPGCSACASTKTPKRFNSASLQAGQYGMEWVHK